jgi:hypothetical protein
MHTPPSVLIVGCLRMRQLVSGFCRAGDRAGKHRHTERFERLSKETG